MMIAALWANSGFEGKEGADARRKSIEELEESFEEAITSVMTGYSQEDEVEIDKENPFFAAAERGKERVLAPRNDEGRSVGHVLSAEQRGHLDVDQ